ncbi:LysM peptidoglycan-binding domain-containing protein [Candidatus Microgenomates bacterium]|nr:LysM peptidoglycan-binding domain-containing protein [Candidatus Microgenomates bacterium]
MELKQALKTIKLYESTISMVLGAIVIAVTAFLIFSYFRNLKLGTTSNTGLQTSNETKITYKVSKGDTLWSISEKYYGDGFQWEKIAQSNGLTNSTIEVGADLNIPEVQASEVSSVDTLSGNKFLAETTTQNIQTTVNTSTTGKYTVTKGDSLWKIAVKQYGNGYKWVQIAKANNVANPNTIFTGVQLNLP